MEIIGAIISGIFALIAAFIPIYFLYYRKKVNSKLQVDKDSKYAVYRISDIVKDELRKAELNVDSIYFKPNFTILDLKTYCKKIYYPNYPQNKIDLCIDNARELAYTLKYAAPKEDEKLTPLNNIKLNNLLAWELYLIDVLKFNGISDYTNYRILDIGIGNGYSTENLYRNCNYVTGVDVSNKALEYAKTKHPRALLINNQAEDLCDLANSTMDIILALRVFQSSLFDKKMSLCEIYRILSSGGIVVISIPIMFLKSDGEVLSGLIPPNQREPSMNYALSVAESLGELMDTLNFKDVKISKDSPFEIYISGRR